MGEPRVAVVIEDDDDVRNVVGVVLRQSGFEVHSAATGHEGVETVRRSDATIVTVDVGLPDIDGYEVLRRIRRFSNCYVIMLSSRAEELDTLTGLQSGADDYVAKPFRPRELRARMEAMLRRPRSQPAVQFPVPAAAHHPAGFAPVEQAEPPAARHPGTLEHNGLVLNPHTRSAALQGTDLELTRSEFDLLHELMRARGNVCSKADLVRTLRGEPLTGGSYVSDADERTIDFHVGNLRRKLGENRHAPRWLQTVRGVGYRLAPRRLEQPG